MIYTFDVSFAEEQNFDVIFEQGGGSSEINNQDKTVTPTEAEQIVTYDAGYTGLGEVTVNRIPTEYIIPSGTKTITENGSGIDVAQFALADVNVPNSYTAQDEGKVVSNGSLVSQISDTVTQNGTLDTTLISSLLVNVSGGGGLEYETGTYEPTTASNPTIYFTNAHDTAPAIIVFADVTETAPSVNRLTSWRYVDFTKIFGTGVRQTGSETTDKMYAGTRVNTNNVTSFISAAYTNNDVTAQSFKTYLSGNAGYNNVQPGQTYKWIAIWV